MKIIGYKGENFKRLKVVEIKPDGNIVMLTGKNEAGKTSVLDSIFLAFTGKCPEKPIREGEEKAVVTIDIGDFIVKKIITKKTVRLEVTTKEGHILKSPQAVLNNLIGKLAFDPLEFRDMKTNEQRDMLLSVLGIDFTDEDKERQEAFDLRTIVTREGKKQLVQLEKYHDIDFSNTPEKNIDVLELNNNLNKINNEFDKIEGKKETIKIKDLEILEIGLDIKRLQEDLFSKEQRRTRMNAERIEIIKYIDSIDLINLKKEKLKLETEILNAEDKNAEIKKKKEFKDLSKTIAEGREEYAAYNNKINEIDAGKIIKIQNSKMPIDGLSFNESTVLFNNIPFSQLSSAQQLKISFAMAMSLNPELRVISISDGSLLDSENLKIIEEMAKEKDYQVWIERVDESGKIGIYFEEGEIK